MGSKNVSTIVIFLRGENMSTRHYTSTRFSLKNWEQIQAFELNFALKKKIMKQLIHVWNDQSSS